MRVTVCPHHAGLIRIIEHSGLTQILYEITCIDTGVRRSDQSDNLSVLYGGDGSAYIKIFRNRSLLTAVLERLVVQLEYFYHSVLG